MPLSRRSISRTGACALLLSDLDFTLAPKSCPAPDEAVRAWIALHAARGHRGDDPLEQPQPRSRRAVLQGSPGIRYIGWAKKPWPPGFRRARALTGVPAGETAMLGDKLLTDMLGANLNGCLALMVEPMGGAVTPWQKVLHALQCPFKALAWEK